MQLTCGVSQTFLKMNRQRAARQMGNDIGRLLHVLAELVIAVGFVPGFLNGDRSLAQLTYGTIEYVTMRAPQVAASTA